MQFALPDHFFALLASSEGAALLQRPGGAQPFGVDGVQDAAFQNLLNQLAPSKGQDLPLERQILPLYPIQPTAQPAVPPVTPLPVDGAAPPTILSGPPLRPFGEPKVVEPKPPQRFFGPLYARPDNLFAEEQAPPLPALRADSGKNLAVPLPQSSPEVGESAPLPLPKVAEKPGGRAPRVPVPVYSQDSANVDVPEVQHTVMPRAMTVRPEQAIAEPIEIRIVDGPKSQPPATVPVALVSNATEVAARTAPQEIPVTQEMNPAARDFPQRLVEQVRVLTHNNGGEARIRLNPPELGTLDIRVQVADDKTFVTFTASHSSTREVLEQSMGRLRTLFDSAGLQLSDAEVSDNDRGHEPEGSYGDLAPTASHSEPMDRVERPRAESSRIVDLYA